MLASLRFDDDLAKGLIPTHTENVVDQGAFEEIAVSAIRSYLSNKCCSGEECTGEETNDGRLGPLTSCVLKAILKTAYSKID